ncbi:MAG: hypothetical protein Q9168_008094 [Polycauliona sp. 1 TL-2023]
MYKFGKDFSPPPDGNRSQGWALLSVCWSLVTVALASTILRVWVRTRLTRNLGWDDGHIVIAMITTTFGGGLITASVIAGGLGRHGYYLEERQLRHFTIFGWADWVQTFVTLMFTKTSICLFLLRIVDNKRTRMAIYFLIGCLVTLTIVTASFFFVVCRPLSAYWTPGKEGHCLSNKTIENVIIAQGALTIVSDLICATFPIFFLRGLRVKLRTKVALCLLMGMGVITAVCCIVRTTLTGAVHAHDVTWAISANVGWRLPEVNIGIVCANAPVLRPLYLFFRGRLATQQSGSVTAYSKSKRIPNGVTKIDADDTFHDLENAPSDLRKGSDRTDATVSLEMGLTGLCKDDFEASKDMNSGQRRGPD